MGTSRNFRHPVGVATVQLDHAIQHARIQPSGTAGTGTRPISRIVITTALRLAPDRKSTRLNSSHANISYADHRDLDSSPTRRSSDLIQHARIQPSGTAGTGTRPISRIVITTALRLA